MPMRGTPRRSTPRARTASTCRASDVPKLLIRDLRQVVSPAGATAPLRGHALGELDLIEDGFVLCDGPTIEAVGRMSELGAIADDVRELDGTGLCAIPGLV